MQFKTHFKQKLSLTIPIIGYFRGPQSSARVLSKSLGNVSPQ